MKFNIHPLTPGKYHFVSLEPFHFINEEKIPQLELVYETYGQLNDRKDNVVIVHHALSTNSHAKSHEKNQAPGWWETMIGAGKPIDTDHFFVICINNLGSCYGSSGPISINPATQQAYRCSFPSVTIADMVRSQKILIDALEIKQIHGIVSASMGAMLSLTWAILYPDSVKKLVLISSCYRSYPCNIAIRSLQREIIRLDPAWNQGNYHDNHFQGFVVARKLAHFSYRNINELNVRFLKFAAEHREDRTILTYLDYNARKFVDKFDANSYLYLTQAMDDFDITHEQLEPLTPFKKIKADVIVIAVSSDTLFEPYQQHDLFHMLQRAQVKSQLIDYDSEYGHDTFLVETEKMGAWIKQHLLNLG